MVIFLSVAVSRKNVRPRIISHFLMISILMANEKSDIARQ